ncbi:MAG: cytochrome c biogenesis protein CcdA [Actinomycetota bacterium]|nr:cytochrome c biogenesis protein CcdA [Actinomycetota bacterium]
MSEALQPTLLAAFAVGFISFISPCVLPLVPGYLSAVSGVSVADLRAGSRGSRVLGPAIVFCLSFTVVFMALGMTATGLGSALSANQRTLERIAGAVIVVFGVFLLLTPFVNRLNVQWRPQKLIERAGSGGPLVAGAAFAVAWTPCAGPTLGAILATAAQGDTIATGAMLLFAYSLGLAVPFLLTAVAFSRATTTFKSLRNHYAIVTAISGIVLIAMGVVMFTGDLTRLNGIAQGWLDSTGLNIFGSL